MTTHQRKPSHVAPGVKRAAGVFMFVGLCTLGSAAHAQDPVQVNFTAAGCPQGPVGDITAGRGQQITWQAYQNGQPASVSFDIYFDPLRGQPHRGPQGTIRANIDPNAPTVQYKYTIVGADCPQSPLDPNIFVN